MGIHNAGPRKNELLEEGVKPGRSAVSWAAGTSATGTHLQDSCMKV